MIKFFVDGSNKGLAVGAGVVEVDDFGFMTTHETHRLHPMADSYLSELLAVDLAMDIALKKNDKEILIYVDTFRIENTFLHSFEKGLLHFVNPIPTEHYKFSLSIREKIRTFYIKNGNDSSIQIQKLLNEKFEYTVYTNTAHALSRSYFKHYDELYISDDTPLKKKEAKLELNRLTKADARIEVKEEKIDVLIIKENEYWHSHIGTEMTDKPYVSTRHLVNIFYHTYNNLCKELAKESLILHFHSEEDVIFKMKKSIEYVNCPTDIKNKGIWALEMIEKGHFVIS